MRLPAAWKPLRYHPQQAALMRCTARYVHAAAGRGSGKTEVAKRRIVIALAEPKPWPDPKYFYALPTYGQARKVAWDSIKALVPPEWVKSVNESTMLIKTVFGSELRVVGLDKPQRIEGVQWDGCVIDESCDQKPGHFERSIVPALTHRKGWCWRIGVPKRKGPGARSFKQAFEKGLSGQFPDFASFAWPSEDILSPEEIELAMSILDPIDYNEQYRASWESATGCIFHSFKRQQNVIRDYDIEPNEPFIVSSDFNVNPMCWVIAQVKGQQAFVFDELFIRSAHTQLTLDELWDRWGHVAKAWWFFGDASAKANKTAAAMSDLAIIKNDNRFENKSVYYLKGNPRLKDRFASTNARLCNAKGEVNCFITDNCTHLIDDLESRSYKDGSSQPDDSGDIGHMSDALGYFLHKRWPIRIDLSNYKTSVAT